MMKRLKLPLLIFLMTFLFALFFTYGFNFFWEDYDFFRLDKERYGLNAGGSSKITMAVETGAGFAKDFFAPGRLVQIGFGANCSDRPYQCLTCDALVTLFGDQVVPYRIFKAIIFALNTCIIFVIIGRTSRLLAFLGVLLYISSAEVWISVVYLTDVGLYDQTAILLSIVLFLWLVEEKISEPKIRWFTCLLILGLSNYAVLAKGDGRYLALVLGLYLMLFRSRDLLRHLPFLAVLLLMEIPVLGFFKMLFADAGFTPINIASHNPMPFSQILKTLTITYPFPLAALGEIPVLMLVGAAATHLFFVLRKSKGDSAGAEDISRSLKEQTFVFMLWFSAAFIMMSLARNWNYNGPRDFQLIDLSYFILPFTVFLCLYVGLVSTYFRGKSRSVFLSLCVLLMLAHILLGNFPKLNQFRGGWGNYFIAWDNAEKYINSASNHALALSMTRMHYKPFVFRTTNNRVSNSHPPTAGSDFLSMPFIEKKLTAEGYQDVFVLGWAEELKFTGESEKVFLKETRIIDGNSGDFYDRIKAWIGRPSRPMVYTYRFQLKSL